MTGRGTWHKAIFSAFLSHEGEIIGVVSIMLFFGLWEFIGTSGLVNPLFTSAPSQVWKAGYKMFAEGEIWRHLYVSALEFVFGFGLSAVVGVCAGILLGWYRRLNHVFNPFVSSLYATPRIALLPLVIIWFGVGINSKIAIVFLTAFFPILINTISGVRTLDDGLLKVARSFGASDRQIFLTIALPGSVPFVLTGLRLGVGGALVGVVVGEFFAASAGLGYLISVYGNTFQTDKVFVCVLIVAAWGLVLMELLKRLEARCDAWRPQSANK